MDVIKTTNVGLKCGNIVIPAIKVVVRDVATEHAVNKTNYDDIYLRSMSFVTICGFGADYGAHTQIPASIIGLNPGTYTFGDDNGFKLVEVIAKGGYNPQQITNQTSHQLYYKGLLVARDGSSLYGSSVNLQPMVIYVNEDNKIYSVTYGGAHGKTFVEIRQPNSSGVSVDNNISIYLIDNNYSISEYPGTTVYLNDTGEDITDDITEEIDPENTDPYTPGGDSGPGGGTGTFDGTGDDIDIPGLPTLSAVDTGFITLFNPSAGELRNLANYMWGDLFDIETWKKIFADPMDAILGLSIVPVRVPNGGSRAITVGNISTGVSMNVAAAQYVSVDCGTLNVEEYWGAYLDYDPFTKAEIYLPYIGTHPLAVDDIMGKAVHVVYHVDILSGACCAYVKCGGSVLYSFVGQCSCSIPITGNDWTNVVNGALSIAASIGTMVATGGAAAPMAATAIASTAVNSMKPNVEKSGSMGGMGGMLGVQTPYIILTRPRQALPNSQNKFMGYPSFITRKLSAVSGYTEIESIHLDGIPATEQELSEIESLLKGGVIL